MKWEFFLLVPHTRTRGIVRTGLAFSLVEQRNVLRIVRLNKSVSLANIISAQPNTFCDHPKGPQTVRPISVVPSDRSAIEFMVKSVKSESTCANERGPRKYTEEHAKSQHSGPFSLPTWRIGTDILSIAEYWKTCHWMPIKVGARIKPCPETSFEYFTLDERSCRVEYRIRAAGQRVSFNPIGLYWDSLFNAYVCKLALRESLAQKLVGLYRFLGIAWKFFRQIRR